MNAAPKMKIFDHPELCFGGVITINTDTKSKRPGLGGCRLLVAEFSEKHIDLCLQLTQSMTNKAKLYNLPYTGAKSVVCIKEAKQKPLALTYLAKYIDQLQGDYITAVDIGTDENDMNALAEITPYVSCHTKIGGDPSASTATGIFYAIDAAAKNLFNKPDTKGLTIAIQGVGKVGSALLHQLQDAGAKIIISDIDDKALGAHSHKNITIHPPENMLEAECDILVPCADGNFIDTQTINHLNTRCIIATANLAITDLKLIQQLHENNILYLPDFLVNCGGLMQCISQYRGDSKLTANLHKIGQLTQAIIQESLKTKQSPYIICQRLLENLD